MMQFELIWLYIYKITYFKNTIKKPIARSCGDFLFLVDPFHRSRSIFFTLLKLFRSSMENASLPEWGVSLSSLLSKNRNVFVLAFRLPCLLCMLCSWVKHRRLGLFQLHKGHKSECPPCGQWSSPNVFQVHKPWAQVKGWSLSFFVGSVNIFCFFPRTWIFL